MKRIGDRLIGDANHFTFEQRMFNFTLLLGVVMTFYGGVVDFILYKGGFFYFIAGLVWVVLYYFSRFKAYFKIVSIISFSLLIFVFFPLSWLFSSGSHGVLPYYVIVFIAIIGIVLGGYLRTIFFFSLTGVVVLLIGMDFYYPEGFLVEYDKSESYLILVIHIIAVLLIMAVLITIYSNAYKNEKERAESYSRTIEVHYQQQLYYMENLEQLMHRLKAERHDFNHHLGVIYGLLREEETAAVGDYTEKLVEFNQEYQNIVNTPHSVLRAMLNYKLSIAREEKIKLSLKVNIPEGLKLDEFDMTIITGNLLDNAIEACRKLEEKERYIYLDIHYRPNYLVIRIDNPIRKSQAIKKPLRQGGEYQSSKKDAENHGFGLNNIEYLLNKHHGIMKIVEEENVFKVDIALLLNSVLTGNQRKDK